ncbi:MAG: hypothetical protein WA705_20775 [Candidatus Ozemobacteraceae bacterium]
MGRGAFLTPVFVFASTRNGAGKSSLIGHLATWWRDQGRRVAVIDLNGAFPMQVRCALPRSIPIEEYAELSEISGRLSGRFHRSFFFTNPERISLFPGGLVRDPANFFDDAALRDFFLQVRGTFDLVLINLPPGINALAAAEPFLTRRGNRDGNPPIGVLLTTTDIRSLALIDQLQRTHSAFPYLFDESLYTVFNQIPRGVENRTAAERLVGPAEAREILHLHRTTSIPYLDEWQRQPIDPTPLVLADPSALRQTISAFARRLLDFTDTAAGAQDTRPDIDSDVDAENSGGFGPCLEQGVLEDLAPTMKVLRMLPARRLVLPIGDITPYLEVSDNRLRIRLRITGRGHQLLPLRRDIPFTLRGDYYRPRPPTEYPFTATLHGKMASFHEPRLSTTMQAEPIRQFDDRFSAGLTWKPRFNLEFHRGPTIKRFHASFSFETIPPGVPSLHQMLGITSRRGFLLPCLEPAAAELCLTLTGNEPPDTFPPVCPHRLLDIKTFHLSPDRNNDPRLKKPTLHIPRSIELAFITEFPTPEPSKARPHLLSLTSRAHSQQYPWVSFAEPLMPPPLSPRASPATFPDLPFRDAGPCKRSLDALLSGFPFEPAPDTLRLPAAASFFPGAFAPILSRPFLAEPAVYHDISAPFQPLQPHQPLSIEHPEPIDPPAWKPFINCFPRTNLAPVAQENRVLNFDSTPGFVGRTGFFQETLQEYPPPAGIHPKITDLALGRPVIRFGRPPVVLPPAPEYQEHADEALRARRFAMEAVLMGYAFQKPRPTQPEFLSPFFPTGIPKQAWNSAHRLPDNLVTAIFLPRPPVVEPPQALSKPSLSLILKDMLWRFRNIAFQPVTSLVLTPRGLFHARTVALPPPPFSGIAHRLVPTSLTTRPQDLPGARGKIVNISVGQSVVREPRYSADYSQPDSYPENACHPWLFLGIHPLVRLCQEFSGSEAAVQSFSRIPLSMRSISSPLPAVFAMGDDRQKLPRLQGPAFFRLERMIPREIADFGDRRERPMPGSHVLDLARRPHFPESPLESFDASFINRIPVAILASMGGDYRNPDLEMTFECPRKTDFIPETLRVYTPSWGFTRKTRFIPETLRVYTPSWGYFAANLLRDQPVSNFGESHSLTPPAPDFRKHVEDTLPVSHLAGKVFLPECDHPTGFIHEVLRICIPLWRHSFPKPCPPQLEFPISRCNPAFGMFSNLMTVDYTSRRALAELPPAPTKSPLSFVLKDMLWCFRNVEFQPMIIPALSPRGLFQARPAAWQSLSFSGVAHRLLPTSLEKGVGGGMVPNRGNLNISAGQNVTCEPRPTGYFYLPGIHPIVEMQPQNVLFSCNFGDSPEKRVPSMAHFGYTPPRGDTRTDLQPQSYAMKVDRRKLPDFQDSGFFRLERLVPHGIADFGDRGERSLSELRMLGYLPSEVWFHIPINPMILLLFSLSDRFSSHLSACPGLPNKLFAMVSSPSTPDLVSMPGSTSSPSNFAPSSIEQFFPIHLPQEAPLTTRLFPKRAILHKPTPFENLLNHLQSQFAGTCCPPLSHERELPHDVATLFPGEMATEEWYARDGCRLKIRPQSAEIKILPPPKALFNHNDAPISRGKFTNSEVATYEGYTCKVPGMERVLRVPQEHDPFSEENLLDIAIGSAFDAIPQQPAPLSLQNPLFDRPLVDRLPTEQLLAGLQKTPDFPPFHWFAPTSPQLVDVHPPATIREGTIVLQRVPPAPAPSPYPMLEERFSQTLRLFPPPPPAPFRTRAPSAIQHAHTRPILAGAEASHAAYLYFALFALLRAERHEIPFSARVGKQFRRADPAMTKAILPPHDPCSKCFHFTSRQRGRKIVFEQPPRKRLSIVDNIRRNMLELAIQARQRIATMQPREVKKS